MRKAREVVGAPKNGERSDRRDNERGDRGGFGGRGGGMLGKRRRDDESSDEGDEDLPEEVKRVPMPRDTPPPFPKEVLDKWYQARRDKRARLNPDANFNSNTGQSTKDSQLERRAGTNANSTPLGANDRSAAFSNRSEKEAEKERVVVREEAKTVYESAPVVRDLRKEAVAFVPGVVRKKLDLAKGVGVGGLLEPEEADRLERAGYMGKKREGSVEAEGNQATKGVTMEEVEDEDG